MWLLIVVTFLVGCAHSSDPMAKDRQGVRDALSQEISLKADRSKLAELRKQIPQSKKDENDELALYLNWMGQVKENPNDIRQKFQDLVERKRTKFRQKVEELRKNYHQEEEQRRDGFLQKQQEARSEFKGSKHTSKESHRFFHKLDQARLNFFSKERDRRKAFEAEIYDETKDFNSYMRQRIKEFDEQMHLYSQRYREQQRHPSPVTGTGSGRTGAPQPPASDFERMKNMPATPLTPGSGH